MESQDEDNFISSTNLQDINNTIPSQENNEGGGTEENKDSDENVEAEEIYEIIGKRKYTSDAWNHFRRVMVDQIQYAECNYCKTRLKASPTYGTTHLRKHYDKSCKKRSRKMDIRQSFLVSSMKGGGNQELSAHIFNQEESRNELAKMVILHDYCLSIVTHIGFRKFVSSLQPCFNMISRNTLRNDVVKIFHVQRSKCYKTLDKLSSTVAITTDMWTSSNNKKGFIAITGHYIDDSWILHSCILRFVYVPAPHTSEVLSDILVESFMEWNIDRKLSTITVDNCTTNDSMIHLLVDKLSNRYLLLNGKVLHMRCCAHILNLIVKDGMEVISGAIERIRDSVVFWTASPARIEKFEDAARQLHVESSKKLSLDCKTRWNSTYLMLETAIKYRYVFPRVKYRERYYKNVPTDEDWVNAIDICAKLKTFYQVTEMFSGTLYPTSNFYFPKICDIKLKLDEWVKSPNPIIRGMPQKMLEKYVKYWDNCHIMMGVAAVLDPRYKMKLVEFYFPLIYGERSQSKVDEVRRNCCDLLVDYQSRATKLMRNSGGLGILGSSCVSNVDASDSDILDMYDKFVASSSSQAASKSLTELDMYLEEIVLPRTQHFDILSWWKTNGVKYPNLQKMAKDILAIPVSTVASESSFSNSGRIVGPHRSRLSPTTLEAMMCSRRWLWGEVEGNSSSSLPICPTILDEEEDDPEECATEISDTRRLGN